MQYEPHVQSHVHSQFGCNVDGGSHKIRVHSDERRHPLTANNNRARAQDATCAAKIRFTSLTVMTVI